MIKRYINTYYYYSLIRATFFSVLYRYDLAVSLQWYDHVDNYVPMQIQYAREC